MRRTIRCYASRLKPQDFYVLSRGFSGEHGELESLVLLPVRACMPQSEHSSRENARKIVYERVCRRLRFLKGDAFTVWSLPLSLFVPQRPTFLVLDVEGPVAEKPLVGNVMNRGNGNLLHAPGNP